MNNSSTNKKTGLTILTILLLLTLPLVGVIVMFVSGLWSTTVRIIVTVLAVIYSIVIGIIILFVLGTGLFILNFSSTTSTTPPPIFSSTKTTQLSEIGDISITTPSGWVYEYNETPDDEEYNFKTAGEVDTITVSVAPEALPTVSEELEQLLESTYDGYATLERIELSNGYGLRYEFNDVEGEVEGFSYLITVNNTKYLCESNGGFTYNFEESMKACESIRAAESE